MPPDRLLVLAKWRSKQRACRSPARPQSQGCAVTSEGQGDGHAARSHRGRRTLRRSETRQEFRPVAPEAHRPDSHGLVHHLFECREVRIFAENIAPPDATIEYVKNHSTRNKSRWSRHSTLLRILPRLVTFGGCHVAVTFPARCGPKGVAGGRAL